ncbi:MAG: phenylacetate-CoA oxygenase subunit PaaI [Alphaproteobacteria bacterium]|nr:phenylacetate-CoA oxygenase subunit PaaI [Alphaproteobacteria bacterium]
MQPDETEWLSRLAAGACFEETGDLPPFYRQELTRLLCGFVDSELAGAAGFADFINRAPGLPERIVLARIVSEKFDHARAGLALLERFGVRPDLYVAAYDWSSRLPRQADPGQRRLAGDRRLNIFHAPLESWEDVTAQMLLMGQASVLQLGDLAQGSYGPLARMMPPIVERERAHAEEGEQALSAVMAMAGGPGRAQASVDYWWPRVAASFGRQEPGAAQRHLLYRLRARDNARLLAAWRDGARDALARLGLAEPAT